MTASPKPILRELPAEITSERVLIRPYRAGDGAALWEAVAESREHIKPWLPWGDLHKTPEDSEIFVRMMHAKWLTREDMPMGIWDLSSGRYLGGTGLHRINWDVPCFEIGYWLRKSAEGHGYISEASWLLTQMCFETLHAQRVEIHVAGGNVRSAAVPLRLGFIHEATLRNKTKITTGEVRDMLIFSMIPEEYAAKTAG